MDIEKLTKHQVVLLTLLVSFVTSIATGIVTVSLMDYAPPSVTRTINQIVERTVEKVVPPETQTASAATVVTKETTVVVKDDDLAAQSIGKVQKAIIRIVSKNDPEVLLARGIVIDNKGIAISDRGALEPLGTLNFEAILPSGVRVPAAMRIPNATTSIAILDLEIATSSSGLEAATLAQISKVRLGASVIRIGGTGADTVGTGVIAKLPDTHSDLIEASVLSTTPGSVLINLFGEVVGVITTDSLATGSDSYTIPSSP